MSERSRNGSYAVAISNRAAYERSRELRARIVPVVGAGLAIEAGAPSTEALKTALARAAGACRIMGVSLLRKPPTYESTLTRSSGCGQRGVCRCLTRPTLGPRSATACKIWRPAIGLGGAGWSSGALPGPGQCIAARELLDRRDRDRADLDHGWIKGPTLTYLTPESVVLEPSGRLRAHQHFAHKPVPPAVRGWGHRGDTGQNGGWSFKSPPRSACRSRP
jgi:hypothetical protein